MQTGGGGVNPGAVTQSFFEDLELALQDPQLADVEARDEWVERLTGYFAPNERVQQRSIISAALASFARDMSQLGADERLTIEIRFDSIEKLSDDGVRALMQPVNGRVYLMITRGNYITHERETPLATIIGRRDGSVPTVKVGNSWFLTEQ